MEDRIWFIVVVMAIEIIALVVKMVCILNALTNDDVPLRGSFLYSIFAFFTTAISAVLGGENYRIWDVITAVLLGIEAGFDIWAFYRAFSWTTSKNVLVGVSSVIVCIALAFGTYALSPSSAMTRYSRGSSFTNKYGTSSTICSHYGCTRTIAKSGDTNCCTTHSNRCGNCNCYIDEDAMFCMDCIKGAIG